MEATKLVKFELPSRTTVKIKVEPTATVADLYMEAFTQLPLESGLMLSRRKDGKMVDLTFLLDASLADLKVFNEVVKVKVVQL